MTNDELIAKQQLEIEELKKRLEYATLSCKAASLHLYRPEQWSMESPDFPKVAMLGIVKARQALEDI